MTLTSEQWRDLELRLATGCECCGRRLVEHEKDSSAPRIGVRIVQVQQLHPLREGGARLDTWDVAVCVRCYQRYRQAVGAAMVKAA